MKLLELIGAIGFAAAVGVGTYALISIFAKGLLCNIALEPKKKDSDSDE